MASVTSGAIASERLSEGNVRVAAFANVFAVLGAILVSMCAVTKPGFLTAKVVLAQVLGAFFGIFVVHRLLGVYVLDRLPWLSWMEERPPQLVNDAVAALGVLLLVWAFAERMFVRGVVAGLALVAVYRRTAEMWHLDRAPHGFELTVQQLVAAQFVSVAVAIFVFHTGYGLARSGRWP